MSHLASLLISRAAKQRSFLSVTARLSTSPSRRSYCSTLPILDEDGAASVAPKEDPQINKRIALEYGRRRAAYKRQVSELRKEYLDEYLRHKAEDDAERARDQAEATRHRLERQRAKNERSAENAIRQEELRRQTHLAFQDHLQRQQEIRDEKNELMRRARQLLIDELEEEAHLWMTTPEEVDNAFTHEAEQLLWARPNGVLGVPNPSLDSHFWQYECHTWHMQKTYKTQREILLEEIEEETYNAANIDPNVWTPERIAEQDKLERKARLRALVRNEGRKALVKKQMEYLHEEQVTEPGEPPKAPPVPSLRVLSDIRAQEKEGSEMLFKDPTKFFIFDRSTLPSSRNEGDGDGGEIESNSYSGPSLGVPIDVRDPLRSGSPQGRVFPRVIGKMPKPDMRSEKERKRQEREDRLWAAAQAQARTDQDEIDMAADEDMELGEPLDYDSIEDWDSDDEEWIKGLDPEADADIINIPRELRYKEEDIEWVIEQLEKKASQVESNVRNSLGAVQQELRSKLDRQEKERQSGVVLNEESKEDSVVDQADSAFLDVASLQKLEAAGVDATKLESVLSGLSQDQLVQVFDASVKVITAQKGDEEGANTVTFESLINEVPGLSPDDVAILVEMNTALEAAEETSAAEEV
jgi:hypothetical protein